MVALSFAIPIDSCSILKVKIAANKEEVMGEFLEVHVEGIIMDLTQQTGAMVVYCRPALQGQRVDLQKRVPITNFKASIVERLVNGRSVFAAVFPRLPTGDYDVYGMLNGKIVHKAEEITVFPGEVAEVDWR